MGPVDAVLVSHVHHDHLHLPSMRQVAPVPRLVVPAGSRRLVESLDVVEIDEVVRADVRDLGRGGRGEPVSVEVVHAVHSCRRGPHSSVKAQAVGYVLCIGDVRIYFAGDTDLFDGMKALGPIDVALVPIWGWGSSIGPGHLDPIRAATATQWIDPAHVVPIHWGTYSPISPRRSDPPWLVRPIGEFSAALDDHGLGGRLRSLEPGGSFELEG
jgi:L-ascorbate metabolism protein UlaG (beta-lactamase superfamily)